MQLTFRDMTKAYGGAPALSGVTLSLEGGRVHALMGENGAGKSTLIKLIAGVVGADSLTVLRDGTEVPLTSPGDATAAGFRVIHQELMIVPQVSVAENILLGHPVPRRFGLVDWRRLNARARAALDELGAHHIDERALAGDLGTGDRMLTRIASALVTDGAEAPCLYVLDEPTAALTGEESRMLFDVIERLKARGAAVLYVSHRMDEVLRICDDVTVLRDGKHVASGPVAATTKDAIIAQMTGRDVKDAYPPRIGQPGKEIVARVQGCTAGLSELDFRVRAGEVLGVAGLAEAGQAEVLRLFLGLAPLDSGTAELGGGALPSGPAQAWARGVAYIPRERRAEALMLRMGVRSNVVLPHLGRFGTLASPRRELRETREMGDRVRLKSASPDQPVTELSGGNQQKVVFARALTGDPRLLLLHEPTRGVDVGAKFDIYTLVRDLSARGCAVLLASSDLPEMLGMCDRVLVLQNGRQAHLRDTDGLSAADLLTLFYPAEAA